MTLPSTGGFELENRSAVADRLDMTHTLQPRFGPVDVQHYSSPAGFSIEFPYIEELVAG
jgi:hypothetical protein